MLIISFIIRKKNCDSLLLTFFRAGMVYDRKPITLNCHWNNSYVLIPEK